MLGRGQGRGRRRRRRSGATRRRPGRSTRRPPAALGLTVEQVSEPARRRLAGRGRAPSCAWRDRTIPVRVRYPGRRTASIPRAWRATPLRAPDGRLGAARPWLGQCVATGDGELILSARTCGRWPWSPAGSKDRDLGSAATEIQGKLRRPQAAGRLLDRGRRPVRVAAPGLPRAAAGVRRSPPRWCFSSWWSSSARFTAGAAPPARGAALASAAPSCCCCSPARSSTSPPPWG